MHGNKYIMLLDMDFPPWISVDFDKDLLWKKGNLVVLIQLKIQIIQLFMLLEAEVKHKRT